MTRPTGAAELVHIIRDPLVECVHRGHVAVWHYDSGLIAEWGDIGAPILPRSAMKMMQALPLVESGAADAAGLSEVRLALSCASHKGAAIHTDMVTAWLSDIGLSESDLRCGPQIPDDADAAREIICSHGRPDQRHNNCSGKHTGFLTLSKHLGGGPEYLEIDHPVQQAVRAAVEEVTGDTCDRYAIDGCSAPNFVLSLRGFARGLAAFAAAEAVGGARGAAMLRLRTAMVAHPQYVSGEQGASTRLMRATNGRAAVKSGAEGVFAAIIPEKRLGVALKIEDGAGRASEAVVASMLIGAGVLDPQHPEAQKLTFGPLRNRRDLVTGRVEVASDVAGWTP
jgi:L-asparaginase II